MKLAFALLLLGTTLGTGTAALAGTQGPSALRHPASEPSAALTLIDSDGDDDDGGKGGGLWPKSRGDDDDGGDDEDDDCEEEDDDKGDCAAGTNGTAAKAGTVAPPQNGLFTNGTAPVVKTN